MAMTLTKDWKPRPALSLLDQKRTQAVLALTAPRVVTETDARRVLRPILQGRARSVSVDGSPSFATYDWEMARNWMLEWLPRIRGYGSAKTAEQAAVRREVSAGLSMSHGLEMQLGPGGIEFVKQAHLDTLSVTFVSMVPFLIPNGWPPSRLAECRYRNCRRWFLRPPPQRGTKPEYCKPSHASAERVTTFRERARKAARKSTRKAT